MCFPFLGLYMLLELLGDLFDDPNHPFHGQPLLALDMLLVFCLQIIYVLMVIIAFLDLV